MTKQEYDKQYHIKNKEKHKLQAKKYYAEHKQELKKYSKEWALKHPEKILSYGAKFRVLHKEELKSRRKDPKNRVLKRIYDKKYRIQHLAEARLRARKQNQRLRLECIRHYGNKCACCGETRIEFLSIDHINGGGNAHRRTITTTVYRWLKQHNFPTGFRVLCHNCNMSKAFYGFCPHNKDFK